MNGCESFVTKKEPWVFYRKNKLGIIYSFAPCKSRVFLSFRLPVSLFLAISREERPIWLVKDQDIYWVRFFFFFWGCRVIVHSMCNRLPGISYFDEVRRPVYDFSPLWGPSSSPLLGSQASRCLNGTWILLSSGSLPFWHQHVVRDHTWPGRMDIKEGEMNSAGGAQSGRVRHRSGGWAFQSERTVWGKVMKMCVEECVEVF